MAIQLGRFEMPSRLVRDEATATPSYAKFVAEPFEGGYGHTLGNALRRALLSSIEGAAITSIRIGHADHEFTSLPGVKEDVTEIVLNLKKVLLRMRDRTPRNYTLSVNKEGKVTAGDIQADQNLEVVNPDHVIATLDKKLKFEAEFEVRVGRGYATAEDNKKKEQSIGVIPIDAIFSPVRKVRYAVSNTRVGQRTDYDKLEIEIWTDGRITPDDALLHASAILRHHLDVYVNYDKEKVEFEAAKQEINEEQARMRKLLSMSVNEIELSVRAANCLNNANILTVGQLAQKSEPEMLKYRNFGKKSLNEIKDKLANLGLSLGMKFEAALLEPLKEEPPPAAAEGEDEGEAEKEAVTKQEQED
ncbi:MAG: DNA-directed RNA polymerase subunit alpha [Verrucomicrobiae bacterium]|nr:DNA-directed RNA polymerase subunit alpha [Verrucomicrobiae bacterium]